MNTQQLCEEFNRKMSTLRENDDHVLNMIFIGRCKPHVIAHDLSTTVFKVGEAMARLKRANLLPQNCEFPNGELHGQD